MALNPELEQLLVDFVGTAKADNFNLDVTLAKFPELQKVDPQLLVDFAVSYTHLTLPTKRIV